MPRALKIFFINFLFLSHSLSLSRIGSLSSGIGSERLLYLFFHSIRVSYRFYSRMRSVFSHENIFFEFGIAPSDEVREQISARSCPESDFRRNRFYVIRCHFGVIAG